MRLLTRFRQVAISLLLLCLVCYCLTDPAMARSRTTKTSSVTLISTSTAPVVHAAADFSLSRPQKNLSGFLHGVDSVNPPDTMLSPLKPAWWRVAANDTVMYSRAVRLGAQPIIVVSDAYGYPQDNWQGNGAPWENNWVNWEAKVHLLAQQYKNIPVYWDIWNEPDSVSWNVTQFWNGTPAQYFETYKRAYTILRQELGPNAMIGGPSYANYDQTTLTAFLNYCNQNNLQVNFLSWHELSDVDFSIPSVAQHAAYMRSLANSMPNLHTQKILINESVGPMIQYFPGDIIGTLYYLELGGADGADKSCWNNSKGQNNCFNSSVDGIINSSSTTAMTNPTPRAGWWAYKTYADGIASRVAASSDNANLVVMASKTPGQVLLGYIGTNTTPVNVSLNLRNLTYIGQKGSTVHVNISKVPNSGELPVSALTPVSSTTASVVNGSATITITGIKLHEEYVLSLTP